MADSLDVQAALLAIVTNLQEALSSLGAGHLQVQARFSDQRLLVRLEGDPLPAPDPLLESLLPALEQMALLHKQRHVELFGFPINEGIPEWHQEWRYQPQPNPNSPLYRARQGEVEAIQYLFNYLLRPEGIQARVHLHPKLGFLQINLQAAESPDPAWAKDFIRRTLARLELPFLQRLRLSGQKIGSFLPTWSQEFDLKQASFWQVPARTPRPTLPSTPEEGLNPERLDPSTPSPDPSQRAQTNQEDGSGSHTLLN